MPVTTLFGRRSRPVSLILGLLLIAGIGGVDFLSGYELSFSLFYVIPIALVTWHSGRWPGLFASFVSACAWLWADTASGHPYSHLYIPLWNTLIRFSFFVIITVLLAEVAGIMEREKTFARIDSLTGATNSRFFFELAQRELDRLQRFAHPLTLVYIDLDNFKAVNDEFGHAMGDEVLRTVARHAETHLRKTDVFARLGGDEFAVLLPQTDQEAARTVLAKLHGELREIMQGNAWPVTFSMGALTCLAPPPALQSAITMADDLMYAAKKEGKDAIRYARYPDSVRNSG